MKKLLIGLIFNLVLITSKLVAQTWVTIPDANFVTYLQSIIPAAMNGNQMNTSSTLVTTRDSIEVGSKSISNLTGIQYFTSLKYLDCGYNSLTSIPNLSNTITYLVCQNNSLTSLPTLPASLKYLDCLSNSLTNLPTLPNSLTFLNCQNNSLTSLPSLPNSLQELFCMYNSLTTLPTLPNSLLNLWCQNNNIVCFPTFPASITNLDIWPNNYNCLPNYIPSMTTGNSYSAPVTGTLDYPLCATGNTNSCPVAVAGIEQVTGLNSQISVYPNPAKDVINVKGLAINEETHVQIIDMFGKFVRDFTASDKVKKDIDISGLEEGVYNLNITNKEGSINKKLVIVN